jgi:type IV fimbrial biogenesis protein FimT
MEMNRTIPPSRCAGFTLVELMVALVVLAILTTVAIPSFNGFILNQRVKATAFELVATLNYGRSEAIKQNQAVTVQAVSGDWLQGWTLQANGATLRAWDPPGRLDIDANVTAITFQRDGRANAAVTFDVCDEKFSADVTRRTVRLDLSGRPNLTRGTACDT